VRLIERSERFLTTEARRITRLDQRAAVVEDAELAAGVVYRSGMDNDVEFARQVVDAGQYLVLATADADGHPWPTPVWFGREGREFVWVSWPDARHSANIKTRSTVGFVIFETPVPVEGRTRAVYAEATAAEVLEADRDRCIGIYDRRARAHGLGTWTTEHVVAPADLRLYHAVISRLFVLHPDHDVRVEVELDL
jgi:nitroimidazol reductase NimA-like FMN-containing flavoprotein (pyridoxamine 5'-phosphate oxidase superfamily)